MIAILGATGYIGRSLARVLAAGTAPLHLFCRDPARLADEPWPAHVRLCSLADFSAASCRLVINAIGAGDPARVASLGAEILALTEIWDSRVLSTMGPETAYAFLSSGAIYGELALPATGNSVLELPVNRLGSVSPYLAAKLVAELRHRQLAERRILDLRIFGYADVGISLHGKFFLGELARSIVQRVPFATSPDDIVRDYAAAEELIALVDRWQEAGAPNCALDLYSREPLSKLALLDTVERRYGTEIVMTPRPGPPPARRVYASEYRAAAALGYRPQRSATEIILSVLDALRASADRPGHPPEN